MNPLGRGGPVWHRFCIRSVVLEVRHQSAQRLGHVRGHRFGLRSEELGVVSRWRETRVELRACAADSGAGGVASSGGSFGPSNSGESCSGGGGGESWRGGDVAGAGPRSSRAGGDSHLHLLLSYAGWRPDPWIERLPRLLEPMGVQSHVAMNGRQAGQLIAAHRIHVAVVDLGLPLDETGSDSNAESDEFSQGGPRLLELLARLSEPPPVVAVKRSRTHRDDTREIAAALRLGAFAVVDRPHDQTGLNLMLEVLRRCLARHYKGCWPGAVQVRGAEERGARERGESSGASRTGSPAT